MPTWVFYLLTLAVFGAIYGTLAMGLNIQWGYTGILDFMYIAFVAVGGYVTSLFMLPPSQPAFGEVYVLGLNWPFIPAFLVGGLASALLAFIVGLLTLNRLRSDYFAIVTVAVSLVLYTIAGNDRPLVNCAWSFCLSSTSSQSGSIAHHSGGRYVVCVKMKRSRRDWGRTYSCCA